MKCLPSPFLVILICYSNQLVHFFLHRIHSVISPESCRPSKALERVDSGMVVVCRVTGAVSRDGQGRQMACRPVHRGAGHWNIPLPESGSAAPTATDTVTVRSRQQARHDIQPPRFMACGRGMPFIASVTVTVENTNERYNTQMNESHTNRYK